MGESSVRLVADRMRQLGLDHEVFDPAETAADLADRTILNDSLDDLLDSEPAADPTAFDPRWPT